MKTWFKTLCFAILVLLAGCNMEKEIELNLPEFQSEIAVECYLEAGKPYRATIMESTSYFDRPEPIIRVAVTQLVMDDLSDEALEEYLTTGEWQGKAGAFGYQDRLGWVHVVDGSESNVVGLPLEMLAEMLTEVAAG